MRELPGKTAVVTGGGSGIGEGTVHALADAGMNVAVVDINGDAAERVAGTIRSSAGRVIALQCDVTDRRAVHAMADAVYQTFDAVQLLHNNAGVALYGPVETMAEEQWRLTLDVNIMGVVNGLQAFLPRIRNQHGQAHIVNTASLGGLLAGPSLAAYGASKAAIVAISEALHKELAPDGIGVSVLCPGGVMTNLMETSTSLAGIAPVPSIAEVATEEMGVLDPMEVGRMVRAGIEADELYIMTHPEFKAMVKSRFDSILEAFDHALASKA